MDLPVAIDFARRHHRSVLATLKRDGRPQLSNVTHGVTADDVVRVSITATRAKYANICRDPRISLHVTADDFWSYAVLEGDAELTPVAADPHDATVDELVEYYRSLSGEHPNWDDYRAAMVRDQRALLHLRPTRAYGMAP
jgi:PPOX class probable F420-dependent enzyme